MDEYLKKIKIEDGDVLLIPETLLNNKFEKKHLMDLLRRVAGKDRRFMVIFGTPYHLKKIQVLHFENEGVKENVKEHCETKDIECIET